MSDPKQEGHDDVSVASATLLDDNRTVFLELPHLKPVNQLSLGYALKSADGTEHRHTIAYTIHNLGPERMDEAKLNRKAVAGRLSEEELSRLKPDLIARFEQKGKRDARSVRMPALHVAKGESPSLMLNTGDFQATFDGYLKVDLPGKYRFRFAGMGTVEVLVEGKSIGTAQSPLSHAVMEASLHSGYNALQIKYRSEGTASLRVLWESDELTAGPIPPQAFFHCGDDPELLAGERLRQGHVLAQTYHCAQCHSQLIEEKQKVNPWGPPLVYAGDDYQTAWLAARLLEPHKHSSTVTAPCSFDPQEKKQRQQAADVAAYLESLKAGPKIDLRPEVKVPEATEELIAKGSALWEDLNCVACHRFTTPLEKDEYDRVSLHYTAAKFTPSGLLRFFGKPSLPDLEPRHRQGHLELMATEAAALHAYLRKTSTGTLGKFAEFESSQRKRGEKVFFERNCHQCHENFLHSVLGTGYSDATQGNPLNLGRGCLADGEPRRGKAPAIPLDKDQKAIVVSYLKTTGCIVSPTSPMEESQRLIRELRCNACHNRDGVTAQRMAILADESETGLTPEMLPDLTWSGEKLQTSVLISTLDGDSKRWTDNRIPEKPRSSLAQIADAELPSTFRGNCQRTRRRTWAGTSRRIDQAQPRSRQDRRATYLQGKP